MRKLTPLLILSIAACDSPASNTGTADTTVQADGDNVLEVGGGDATTTSNPPVDTVPADTAAPDDTTQPIDTAVPVDTTPADTAPADTGTVDSGPGDTNVSNDTGADTGGGDTVGPASTVGAACTADSDCGAGGACLDLPGGYCSVPDCDTIGCPAGASCWGFTDGESYCLDDCAGAGECRGADGYICDGDDTCWPGTVSTGASPVGGACQADGDCRDAGAFCYPAQYDGEWTGFFEGYCMIPDCTASSCPAGSVCEAIFADGGTACVDSCDGAANGCNQGYGCFEPGLCFPSCAESGCPANYACDPSGDICVPSCTPTSCPAGLACRADGTCGDPPCTAGSCGAGYVCAPSGDCVPDLSGGPGSGPGPTCNSAPPRDCTANCGDLVPFEPDEGPGYWDYPINGETTTNEYRSYCRRDLMMLIKWAAAMVDCKAAAWAGGNDEPLGLGDMSESDGSIPGTSIDRPGHPEGTHVDGYDMDIAYYQTAAAPDNRLRPVCPYTEGGQDASHCVGEPNTLDVWRNALFLGYLLQSPRTRVIGVDGKIGPIMEQALDVLCGNGWLDGTPCGNNRALAYETTNQGYGWYYFHHHHQHISLKQVSGSGAPSVPGAGECLVPGCGGDMDRHATTIPWGDGVATTLKRPPVKAQRVHAPAD